MNPFSVAIPFGLIGPALAVGGLAWCWRRVLPHVWWFIGIGALAWYMLMAVCLVSVLADVGITGDIPATPTAGFDPLTLRYLSVMLAWLAGSAMMLYLARYLLSKL